MSSKIFQYDSEKLHLTDKSVDEEDKQSGKQRYFRKDAENQMTVQHKYCNNCERRKDQEVAETE